MLPKDRLLKKSRFGHVLEFEKEYTGKAAEAALFSGYQGTRANQPRKHVKNGILLDLFYKQYECTKPQLRLLCRDTMRM